MKRRNFFKTLGVAGASTLPLTLRGNEAVAADVSETTEFNAILIDTTYCVGCRSCEMACAETNGFPEPDEDSDAVFVHTRQTTTQQYSVVNRFETTDGDEIFVKKQCMHCVQPACASACLTKAMYKTPEGPVIWRESKCMGCRFCMLSCPYDAPKFEYDSPNPAIRKCQLCASRLRDGEIPACAEACPAEAVMFGTRRELLRIARERIHQNPDDYHPHIYGEHEAGGSSVLYLSSVPFEELGFRTDLRDSSYPELTTGFLYSVPIVLALWPPFLLALRNASKQRNEEATDAAVHVSDNQHGGHENE